MANGHGGIRKGQGRKSKADELHAAELGANAIVDVYGSLEKYWKHIAEESKDSLPHLKLIHEYLYGKPKETRDLNVNMEQPLFDIKDV